MLTGACQTWARAKGHVFPSHIWYSHMCFISILTGTHQWQLTTRSAREIEILQPPQFQQLCYSRQFSVHECPVERQEDHQPLTSSQRASPDLPFNPPARAQIGALIYAEQKQSFLCRPTGVQTSVPLSDRMMITQVNTKPDNHMEMDNKGNALRNGTKFCCETFHQMCPHKRRKLV